MKNEIKEMKNKINKMLSQICSPEDAKSIFDNLNNKPTTEDIRKWKRQLTVGEARKLKVGDLVRMWYKEDDERQPRINEVMEVCTLYDHYGHLGISFKWGDFIVRKELKDDELVYDYENGKAYLYGKNIKIKKGN